MDETPQLSRLLAIMARLRDPDGGCPWDVEQTFRTIAPYTIEEAYEVADAIEAGDLDALREELGDLLLQVVYHARMAEEAGRFRFDDVARAVADKMVARHPHVFGDTDVADAAAQTRAWEDHKAAERRRKADAAGRRPSALDDVVVALPALTRAEKLQKRAARVGFDWPDVSGPLAKIAEETDELKAEIEGDGGPERLEAEVGDLLFSVVNLARHLRVDPESALRRSSRRFETRFRSVESQADAARRSLPDMTIDELEALWVTAKRRSEG